MCPIFIGVKGPMNFMKKAFLSIATDTAYFVIGTLIYSSAVTVFVSANEISPAGFTGIASILNYTIGIPTGLAVLLLNIPVIIIGYIKLGGIFILKTGAVTILLSVWLDISDVIFKPFKTDGILAALFGGILMGVGLSLVMLRGATTGGVDIIAKLVNRRMRHIGVGRIILIIDAVVIVLAAVVYKNIESALYSIVAVSVSSRVIDTLIYGADKGKIVYIITGEPDLIATDVAQLLHRGVTRLSVKGGYTGEERTMLMCAVRRHEVSQIYDIVREYDAKAFIVVGEAGEIIGEGFKMHNA